MQLRSVPELQPRSEPLLQLEGEVNEGWPLLRREGEARLGEPRDGRWPGGLQIVDARAWAQIPRRDGLHHRKLIRLDSRLDSPS